MAQADLGAVVHGPNKEDRSTMKSRGVALIAAILATLWLSTTAVATQQQTESEAIVRAMFDAFNRGDVAAMVSYLSEDATATGLCLPAGACNSKAEIEAQIVAEVAEGAQDEIRDLSVSGNVVVVHIAETAPGLVEIGVERVFITITATVVGGKVTHLDDVLDLSDPQTAKFAQALEQREAEATEPRSVPATGTGDARSKGDSTALPIPLFALAGAAVLAAGAVAGRRRVA